MQKVVVVGSGPAGLAAAEALQEEGDFQVELVTLGHHLGGKASSWRLKDGRTVEHGQHIMFGFYKQLRLLLARSGVDWRQATVSSHGDYTVWEDRFQRAFKLHASGDLVRTALEWLENEAFPEPEKARLTSFVIRMVLDLGGPLTEDLDDLCFSAWALSRGFPVSATQSNVFRTAREVQMNWPGEISAYAMLRTLRETSKTPGRLLSRYPRGGMSEIWWEPIARRIEDLGGSITRRQKLVNIRHHKGRLLGLDFARPAPHGPQRPTGSVPTLPGSISGRSDLAATIIAIPPSALVEVMDEDLHATPGLQGIRRLKTVAPLALQVWHRNRSRAKPGGIVAGLEPPLPFAKDNQPDYPDYADDGNRGACLHFAGQLTGYEDASDAEILERALASIRKVDGYEAMTLDGVLDFVVLRHPAPHKRYWNAEPGSLRHKPRSRTRVAGLYLAGDWVRNELDFPCMESAVRSGREAARAVLNDLRRSSARRRSA